MQFSFYFHESECHIFHFVRWWHLCDGYTGKWQCLVAAILYQTRYYSIEPFGKVCMQVINVLLKKGMSFHWCVHSPFWPSVYMFKSLLFNNLSTFLTFSPMWGPDGFFPRVCEVLYCEVLSWHVRCVAASPQPGCAVIVAVCSSCGSACSQSVHCLKWITLGN